MPKISIQFELEDEKDSEKFEKNNVTAATPKCKNANMRKIKRHHGTRNYEKIEIKSFDDVNFSSGNPQMEINRGIIHLYKEKSCGKPESHTLCLLSVPTVISCTEIVNFCSSFRNHISRIRIFSSPSPGLYLSLIKFDDHLTADQFYDLYQGKPIDPNNKLSTCNLAYVESVTYLPSSKVSPSVAML
uniref:BRCA1-associated protein (Trinotate prediction) n=1 Tax=Myxobolus squamalis TaxID=59785 RepID=A0A6B2G092_MYXSQ